MMQPVDWALTRDSLTGPKHLLLVALAWISDGDGVTFKGQKTIAERVAKDDRWVREHLKGLAEMGLVSRFRRHRLNGSRTTDLIVLNMPREKPLDLDGYSGIVGDLEPGDVPPTGGNPPGGPTGGNASTYRREPTGPEKPSESTSPAESSGSARAEADMFPDDLPADLHDVAVAAGKILKATALRRGQKKVVTRAAVGHAVLTYPDRDHVKVARDVEAWLLHGRGARKPCADIVARYRTFLDSSEPMAGPPLPAGVTPMHGGRMAGADRVEAQIRALRRASTPAARTDTVGSA